MPENPNYQNPPQYRPAPEDGELDDATLDRVVGGLVSPNTLLVENGSFTGDGKIATTEDATIKFSIKNLR